MPLASRATGPMTSRSEISNGDGTPDILTRKKETFLWLQQADGSFSKVEIRTAMPNGEGSALADVNRNGRLDIIQNGYWLENPGDPATASGRST